RIPRARPAPPVPPSSNSTVALATRADLVAGPAGPTTATRRGMPSVFGRTPTGPTPNSRIAGAFDLAETQPQLGRPSVFGRNIGLEAFNRRMDKQFAASRAQRE